MQKWSYSDHVLQERKESKLAHPQKCPKPPKRIQTLGVGKRNQITDEILFSPSIDQSFETIKNQFLSERKFSPSSAKMQTSILQDKLSGVNLLNIKSFASLQIEAGRPNLGPYGKSWVGF